jgi:hypothetical protein
VQDLSCGGTVERAGLSSLQKLKRLKLLGSIAAVDAVRRNDADSSVSAGLKKIILHFFSAINFIVGVWC